MQLTTLSSVNCQRKNSPMRSRRNGGGLLFYEVVLEWLPRGRMQWTTKRLDRKEKRVLEATRSGRERAAGRR